MAKIITFRSLLILSGMWLIFAVINVILNYYFAAAAIVGAIMGASALYLLGDKIKDGDSE